LKVIYGNNEAVQPGEYVQNGAVQESVIQIWMISLLITATDSAIPVLCKALSLGMVSYGFKILTIEVNPFRIAQDATYLLSGWISSSGANVFVANHDTERVCLIMEV